MKSYLFFYDVSANNYFSKLYIYLGNSVAGGGNDPPRDNRRLPNEHEVDDVDYDTGIVLMRF